MNLLSCNCQWALKQDGVHFVLCPKQGNKVDDIFPCRVCILGFFVLNRVRVSNLQRLNYTQIPVEFPRGYGKFYHLFAP